jgi:predicted helicase
VFAVYSLGVSTNRDEWLYDSSHSVLKVKVRTLLHGFESHTSTSADFRGDIKWSETLKRRAKAGAREQFEPTMIRRAAYRPYFSLYLYQSPLLIDRPGSALSFFPPGAANAAICFSDIGARTDFVALAVDGPADLHFGAAVDAYQQIALYRFDGRTRVDNITDWSLDQFRKHYQPGRGKKDRPITKEAIFHYVYGVLHDPVYRKKYALNLKREFPRVPFYADFWQWSDWGQLLMDLHIGYESVAPWALARTDVPDEKSRRADLPPKALLKADKDAGVIRLDSETVLAGIPPEAWYYRLGNRSALEWVLDQYKEKTPKDPTIREKFNTYRFADYKDKVIDLLARVTTVSVETMKIVEAMRRASR